MPAKMYDIRPRLVIHVFDTKGRKLGDALVMLPRLRPLNKNGSFIIGAGEIEVSEVLKKMRKERK